MPDTLYEITEWARPGRRDTGPKAFTVASVRRNSVWPPPIYCAVYADGLTVRTSFGMIRGKPFDFEAARRGIAQVIGNERGREMLRGTVPGLTRAHLKHIRVKIGVVTKTLDQVDWHETPYLVFPSADDQVGGWMEHGDVVHLDPAFGKARAIVRARTPIITTPAGKRAFGF